MTSAGCPMASPSGRTKGEGRVDFEFHDEAGDYQGWVMVTQAEGGWFLRWGITCGADTGDP